MYLTTAITNLLVLASASLAVPVTERDNHYNDLDPSFNIFGDANSRYEGAICKNEITTREFPELVVPHNYRGGCVRCLSLPSIA